MILLMVLAMTVVGMQKTYLGRGDWTNNEGITGNDTCYWCGGEDSFER